MSRALAALLLLALAVSPARAEDERVVEADGLAAVVVDPVTARDRALVDARRKAVEAVSGVRVDSRAVTSLGLSVEDWVRVESFGFVRRYEVLQETPGADRYAVRIRAWVRSGKKAAEEAARELLSRRSFLVLARGEGAGAVAAEVKRALLDRGFPVCDEEFLRESGVKAAAGPVPLEAAVRCLADYVVRVESSVAALGSVLEIHSFEGTARLGLTEVSSGLLKAATESSARVFGLSREQALAGQRADQFPAAVARPAAARFGQELDRLKVGAPEAVRVTLEAPTSRDAFDRLQGAVAEVRWVENVRDPSFGPGAAGLVVDYPEKTVYLAADLDAVPGFAVVAYGPGTVTLKEEKR